MGSKKNAPKGTRPEFRDVPPGMGVLLLSQQDYSRLLRPLFDGNAELQRIGSEFSSQFEGAVAKATKSGEPVKTVRLLVSAPDARMVWQGVRDARLPQALDERLRRKLTLAHDHARRSERVPFDRSVPTSGARQRARFLTGGRPK